MPNDEVSRPVKPARKRAAKKAAPKPPEIDNPLANLEGLPDIIAESDALKEMLVRRTAALLELSFDMAEEKMVNGDSGTQVAMLKAVLPLAVQVRKQIETQGEDIEAAKAEVRDMFREMGKDLGN